MAGIDGPHFFYIGGKSGGVEPRSCGMPFSGQQKTGVSASFCASSWQRPCYCWSPVCFEIRMKENQASFACFRPVYHNHRGVSFNRRKIALVCSWRHIDQVICPDLGSCRRAHHPGWQYILLKMKSNTHCQLIWIDKIALPLNKPKKTEVTMERGDKGRFTQNNGGGPGRPKGSRNRSRLLADAISKVFGGESQFIEIILQAAKDGSEPMQKQILDRLIPPASRQSVLDHHLDIGDGTAAERANKIISASLEGEISLEEANALVAMLTSTARLEELEQVKAELEQLKTRIYGDKR